MPAFSTTVTGWKNHTTRRAQINTPEGGFINNTWVQVVDWCAEVVRCSPCVIFSGCGESVLCSRQGWVGHTLESENQEQEAH